MSLAALEGDAQDGPERLVAAEQGDVSVARTQPGHDARTTHQWWLTPTHQISGG